MAARAELLTSARPPLVDAHLHFWDVETQDHGFITGAWSPEHEVYLGDYTPIKQTFVLNDILREFEARGVIKAVHVQADWGGNQIDETLWVASLSEAAHFPLAIVAGVDLRSPDVADQLDRHGQAGRLRGVRNLAYYGASLYEDSGFLRGLAELREREILFELGVTWNRLEDALLLAGQFADTQFVLDHAGMPLARSREELAVWRQGVRALASLENVAVKLSGLGMGKHRLRADDMAPVFSETLDAFGAGRAMLGSNWPVDSLFGTYEELIASYEALTAELSLSEQLAVWRENAERLYRF